MIEKEQMQAWSEGPVTERQNIREEQLHRFEEETLLTIEQAVVSLRQLLYLRGILVTDFYHAKCKEMAFSPEETKILPRVRMDARYGSPSFFWERLTRRTKPISEADAKKFEKRPGTYIGYVNRGGRKTRDRVLVRLSAKVIPLQKDTDSIASTAFDKEPVWAQIAGESAEAQLRVLRKKAKQVSAMVQHLAQLKRLVKSGEEV